MARELDLMGLLVSKGAAQVLLSHQVLTISVSFAKIFRVVTLLTYVPITGCKLCANDY